MASDFLNPEEVLKKLNLSEEMIAADFGCGSGGWAIPLAKILKKGKVYAIDILEEPLSALRGKAKAENIFNIIPLRANVEKGTTLLPESCHLVLMTNLLFQVENIENVLLEGKRVLKKEGIILVVDWKEDVVFGPEEKVFLEKVEEIGVRVGLKTKEKFIAGPHHYGIIFSKN